MNLETEEEMNQVIETVETPETTEFSVLDNNATELSTPATDKLAPPASTIEKKPKLKLNKLKSLDVNINGQVTTMYVDKKNTYPAVNMELWRQLGQPKLHSLSEKWIKRYAKYKFLKAKDFTGYFYANIKLTDEGREMFFLPVLVFHKEETPSFLGRKYFYNLPLDKNKAPAALINPKENDNGKRVQDASPEPSDRMETKIFYQGKTILKEIFLRKKVN